MPSALQVIRSQGPKFLRQLYRENIQPVGEALGPEGLVELATFAAKSPALAFGPAMLLYSAEADANADKPGSHPGARPRHKDFRPSNLPLSRNAGWADARAEVLRQIEADYDAAYRQARRELGAKYPTPSVVIADPEINAERAAARRRLFSDEEALATLLGTRAEELMPQRFAAGGVVKRMARRYFDPDQDVLPTTDIVKEPGGQWLAGGVERAVAPLKTGITDEGAELLQRGLITPEAMAARPDVALNRWLDQKLAKYIRNEMATERDPIRKLAEEGTLHFTPEWVPKADIVRGEAARLLGTDKPLRLGQSQLAQDWEDLSDIAIKQTTADDLLRRSLVTGSIADEAVKANPWVAKVPPSTVIQRSVGDINENLGFGHLVDELTNALNPESGLPAHLLLDHEKLSKVNVADAVRRVSEINAWRAANKAETNRKLAEQAALVRGYAHPRDALTKQFMEQGMDENAARVAAELELSNNAAKYAAQRALAENNPKGLRWVELKAGDLPEGWTHGEGAAKGQYVYSPEGVPAFALGPDDPRYKQLAEALKYEGDVMGHCVGGYCDDVIEGRSRIFSLRDAKGEPHVTVEIEPPMFNRASRWGDLTQEEKTSMLWNLGSPVDKALLGKYGDDMQVYFRPDGTVRIMPPAELLDPETIAKSLNPRIKQIKGKQNLKPNDEYLPFVQDFVRNNPLGMRWSDIGDLPNTGLMQSRFDPETLSRYGLTYQPYVTQAELDDIMAAISKAGGQ